MSGDGGRPRRTADRRHSGSARVPAARGQDPRARLPGRLPGARHPAGAHRPRQGHGGAAAHGACPARAAAGGGLLPDGVRGRRRLGGHPRGAAAAVGGAVVAFSMVGKDKPTISNVGFGALGAGLGVMALVALGLVTKQIKV